MAELDVRLEQSFETRMEERMSTHEELDPADLYVSFPRILEEFERRFNLVFENDSSKAHLDITELLIDGAKGKWRLVLLLDTITSFAIKRDRTRAECASRKFDQYAALTESVLAAASEAFITRCFRGLTDIPFRMCLMEIPSPWDSTSNLREHFLSDASKTGEKRRQAAEQLLSMEVYQEKGLTRVLEMVAGQLYSLHFLKRDRQKGPAVSERFALDEELIHMKCSELSSFSHVNITSSSALVDGGLPLAVGFDEGAEEYLPYPEGEHLQRLLLADPAFILEAETSELSERAGVGRGGPV